MEKDAYNVNEAADYNGNEGADYNGHAQAQYVDPTTGIENKQGRITEAAGIYGDIETAEEYGYVARGYVQRVRLPS